MNCGIHLSTLKSICLTQQTFCSYVQLKRTLIQTNRLRSTPMICTNGPTVNWCQNLTKYLDELRVKLGIEEMSVDDLKFSKKKIVQPMGSQISDSTIHLFSNVDYLEKRIYDLIHAYDSEKNSLSSQKQVNDILVNLKILAEKYLHDNVYAKSYFSDYLFVKPHLFGSRATGLAVKNSDVDIYLQIGPTFCGGMHDKEVLQQQLAILFAKGMKQATHLFQNVKPIPVARVPIIKFTDVASNLNCDVIFKSGLGTTNSMLVRKYIEFDKRVLYLVCAVRLWMKMNNFSDKILFTSYPQIWLVLFFLMQPDTAVVPPVLPMNSISPYYEQPDLFIEGWPCTFCKLDMTWTKSCTLSKEELLYKFFEFYSNLILINYVLCPLTGTKIEKRHFIEYFEDLPSCFDTLKRKMALGSIAVRRIAKNIDGLCVLDPFDHCHNITNAMNNDTFFSFAYLCEQTLELLRK